MTYKVVVVLIIFVSQYTFRYTLFGGRISASRFVCMGKRAWVRGSYKYRIHQTGKHFLLGLASVFAT